MVDNVLDLLLDALCSSLDPASSSLPNTRDVFFFKALSLSMPPFCVSRGLIRHWTLRLQSSHVQIQQYDADVFQTVQDR